MDLIVRMLLNVMEIFAFVRAGCVMEIKTVKMVLMKTLQNVAI